jgi:hypothetical protein
METRPRVATGRYGAAVRRYGPDSPEAVDARRDLAAVKISAAIDSALTAAAAPLKVEHAAQLAARLKGASR